MWFLEILASGSIMGYRFRKLSGSAKESLRRTTKYMNNRYPTCRCKGVVEGPVTMLPSRILRWKCSLSYEIDEDINDTQEPYLTECDIDHILTVLNEYDENHDKYPSKKDFPFIRKYFQYIKDQMRYYRKY